MEILLFPRSGYANRLQAMVSAQILARQTNATLHVCWSVQDVAPATPSEIFSMHDSTFSFVAEAEVEKRWGVREKDIPMFLSAQRNRQLLSLAGHSRGEQYFMPELKAYLTDDRPDLIVLIAGGKFTLEGGQVLSQAEQDHFRQQRHLMYSQVRFAPVIEDSAGEATLNNNDFAGLHLRYSDRSREAPWRFSIIPAVKKVTDATRTSSIFVASDSAEERSHWVDKLQRCGLNPWTVTPRSLNRGENQSALDALVDWRILSRTSGMVYFAASSFGEEAAVASGHWSRGVGIPPSKSRSEWVRARGYLKSAWTYPSRHHWFSSLAP